MRWSLLLLATAFSVFAWGLAPPKACARGIDLFAEYSFVASNSDVEDKKTGDVTEREFSRFSQLYNLNISSNIFPNLAFRGGGILELASLKSTVEGDETETDISTVRPFLELRLTNPIYDAGVGYNKTERKNTSSETPTTRDFLESYNTRLEWRPVGFPRFNVNYTHDHVYDEPRTTDNVSNLLTIGTRYSYQRVDLDYTYTRNESENHLTDFNRILQGHNARVKYSHSFFDGQVTATTGYRFIYTTSGFSGQGEGEFPVLGDNMFALDDDPTDDPLRDFPPGGVNLVGTGERINIGLDFPADDAEVDKIFVILDSEDDIPTGINSLVAWTVYTGVDTDADDDCDEWTSTGSSQSFVAIQNRFEISFSIAPTSCVKVVTEPILQEVAGTSKITVIDIQAFRTVSGDEPDITSEDHNYNLTLAWRISEKTRAAYNFLYSLSVSKPENVRLSSMSNGVNLNHVFNRTFTGSTSLVRTDSKRTDEESTSYNYGASLRANYLPTFRQTLTYSGSRIEEEEGTGYGNSIFLRNDADLYEGWSASLDLGITWGQSVQGMGSTTLFLRTRTEVRPNEKVSVNLAYSATDRRPEDEPSTLRQTGDFRLFVLPFTTLSLFVDITVDVEEGEDTRVRQNYSASWSPFPGGALNISFSYRETLTAEGVETRAYGSNLRWDITRYAFLSLSYTIVESESETEIINSNNLFASLRIRL